ncbi:MAM and LDL-receptor class A domain-containing protein 1-like [Antedon mediterranea]|uniref:MAM and LDL-receptor class A domain-containing protein 1-like n=1 Tax=Antedon mediterranea TaxID=105859 RepID=UPI003AF875C0
MPRLITSYYVFIEASSPRVIGEQAWLVSESFPVNQDFCLSFWYHMYGADAGTFNVYLQTAIIDPSGWELKWTLSGDQGDYWQHALVDVKSTTTVFEVVFEGVIGRSYLGDLALDDTQLYVGTCGAPTDPPPCVFQCKNKNCLTDKTLVCNFIDDCNDGSDEIDCGTCTFEGGQCGWKSLDTGTFEWDMGQGSTPSANTGPSRDHTLGSPNGHFMYVDASTGSSYSKAILLSPDLNDAYATCMLDFWYHMYGSDIGDLAVYLRSGNTKTLMIYLTEDEGDQWNNMQLGIGRVSTTFTIQFEARRSYTTLGDIAIDDVSFKNCNLPPVQSNCGAGQTQCSRGSCVNNDRLCDLTDDCGDRSDEASCSNYDMCDFEQGFCTWQQLLNDELDWYGYTGITPTDYTGPTRDHTTGLESGRYLYLETSSPRKQGDRARIGSMNFRATSSGNCMLRFYYHMYGQNIGTLSVYTRTAINGPLTLEWSKSGNLGDYYERGEIVFIKSQAFQVIIESTVGDGIYGDIAIDDTSFTTDCVRSNNNLPTIPTGSPTTPATTAPPCGTGLFACTDGTCIDVQKKCDGVDDCSDGSDESECGTCTFESGQCGWTGLSNGRYKWERHTSNSATGPYNPPNDHTLGTAAGWYMYVDSTTGSFLTTAILLAPDLGDVGPKCEMDFWYHMRGSNVGTLVAVVYEGLIPQSLVTKIGDQGNQWNSATLIVGQRTAGNYVIRFEATPGSDFQDSNALTDMAIDDVVFTNCIGFQSDLTCTFEGNGNGNICGWKQDLTDDFNWSLQKGSTGSVNTGPQFDHTTGKGYYVYIETSSPRVSGDSAILKSGDLAPTSNNYCLEFWYHMFGPDVANLNVYLKIAGVKNLIWTKTGTQANEWRIAHETVSSALNYEIIFEAFVGKSFGGDIALDDISYLSGDCPASSVCDFEADFCEWTNAKDDTIGFDWQRDSDGTPSVGTGPEVDHTYGTPLGHYVYVETSSPRVENDRARLESPVYDDGRSDECLTFWFHMWGDHIGSLNVYQWNTGDTFVYPSWSRNEDQGNMWRRAKVTIVGSTKTYKIVFEAVTGESFGGDIAIDDIAILDGACPRDGFCDFETDMCGWTNDFVNDDFDWLRDTGGTPSSYTGPTADHTLGNGLGFYVFIETSSPRYVNDKAWLVSEHLSPSAGTCLNFWFHMYGTGIGALNIYTQTLDSSPKLIWSRSDNYGNLWVNSKSTLMSADEFWVIFEGVRGTSHESDIALDDIEIRNGLCAITIAPPTTPVRPTYPADYHDCDFETGICQWAQEKNGDDFDWIRRTGKTSSAGTGPTYDHTKGDISGYYLFIETSDPRQPNDTARLLSQTFGNGAAGVCMNFWYYMYGPHVDELTIFKVIGSSETILWQHTGSFGPQWNYGQIHIVEPSVFYLVVQARRGASWQGDISVDDFWFNSGDCPATERCDFENGDCGYTQDSTDDFDWTLHSGGTPSQGTGPATDHTYYTKYGHYMYAEMSSPRQFRDVARLDSPVYPKTDGKCLQFWYHMYGQDIGTINVYRRVSGTYTKLWSDGWTGIDEWHVVEVTVISSNDYQIVFEAIRGNNFQGDIAIDDIVKLDGECLPFGDCNFETGSLCTWKNAEAKYDDFDWERMHGSTLSGSTGPIVDHTLGSSYGW